MNEDLTIWAVGFLLLGLGALTVMVLVWWTAKHWRP